MKNRRIKGLSFALALLSCFTVTSVRGQAPTPPEVATPLPAAPEATPEAAPAPPEAAVSPSPPEATPPGRSRRGRGGGARGAAPAGRAAMPNIIPEVTTPQPEDTLLGGSVPALWEIEPPAGWMEEDDFPSILQRDTVAPAVPAKVVRYALWLMDRYDTDGDGVLQEAEWKTMPGAPQSIDLDGDGRITLEELTRFLGLYGKNRTIHRPYPVENFLQPRMVTSDFRFFRPVSAPPPPPPAPPQDAAIPETPEGETPMGAADPTVDLTEDFLEQAAAPVDEETYAEIIAGRQTPAARKYYTPPENLRGVPAWFLLRDRDGDGQVSLFEFAPTLSSSALALFGKLDKNGDGFITPDEVRGEESSEDR